jgi:hypothetical protein
MRRWLIWAWVIVGVPALTALTGAAADLLTLQFPNHQYDIVLGILAPGLCLGLGFLGLIPLLPSHRLARIGIAAVYGVVMYLIMGIFGGMAPFITHARLMMPY